MIWRTMKRIQTRILMHPNARKHKQGNPPRRSRLISTFAFCALFALAFFPACASVQQGSTADDGAAQVASQSAVLFRPSFEVGRVSVYQFDAETTAEQAVEDLKITNKNVSHLVMRLEVTGIDQSTGNATVKITYDRLALAGENEFSGINYDFDSERDPSENTDNQVATLLNRLKDTPQTAIVAPDGKVQSVTGAEAVLTAMQRNKALQGRIGEFNPDGIKQILEGFWRVGDDDSQHAVGEQWTESQDMPMPSVGTLTFITDFEVKKADPRQAEVAIVLDVKMALEKDQKKGEADEDAAAHEGDEREEQAIKGEDDPENLVLGPEAKQKAEEKAFQDSLPLADRADLEVDKTPGTLIWDRTRHEMIKRETFLNFSLEIEQFEIFSQKMQTSYSSYDVQSKWKRIDTQ